MVLFHFPFSIHFMLPYSFFHLTLLFIHNTNGITLLPPVHVCLIAHLKIRFGEESLHNCEIVLHDIEESKRTNNAISSFLQQNQQKPSLNVPTDFAVISDNYWPKLNQFKSVYKPLLRTSVASATTSVSSSLVYTDPEFDEDNFKPHPVALQIVKEYAAVYSGNDLHAPRRP